MCRWIYDGNPSGDIRDVKSGLIWFEGSTVLPVELSSFNGEIKNNSVELNWSTESETNNSGFEILKSNNENDWEVIGFIKGNGTSFNRNEYNFRDENPYGGINYYRLKQIDHDGTSEYSKTVSVETPKLGFEVFPNPVNNILTIINNEEKGGQFIVENNKGGVMKKGEIFEKENNINMDDLTPGIYYLKIITNELFVEKIIKR